MIPHKPTEIPPICGKFTEADIKCHAVYTMFLPECKTKVQLKAWRIECYKKYTTDNTALMSNAKLDENANGYFGTAESIAYVQALQDTWDKYKIEEVKVVKERVRLSAEEREEQAKNKVVDLKYRILDMLDEGINLGSENLLDNIKIFLSKYDTDSEAIQELPRRYLPETCNTCEYKKWIEENCERIED